MWGGILLWCIRNFCVLYKNCRLFIFLFVVDINEVICLLCFWRVFIMLFEILVRVLIWEVEMFILFIVVVLKRFNERDLLNGSKYRVFFLG